MSDIDYNEALNKLETFSPEDETVIVQHKQEAQNLYFQKQSIDAADKYFNSEAPEVQRLGQGVHEGVFYIGVIAATGEQGVVTSDHKVYMRHLERDDDEKKPRIHDDIKDRFGLKYRCLMEPGLRAYAWRNNTGRYSVSSWLKCIDPPVSTQEIHARVKGQFERFIDFPDPRIYDFVVCDVLADYVSCLFETRGITHIFGFKGSGKSKTSRLYKFMGFNPLMTSKITPAALFRAVEANCPRVIIDNFDFLKGEELRAAYNQALQTGWEYDGCAHLCDKDHGNKVVAFRTYTPYIINNILGLDDVTADRTTRITMLKTLTSKGKLKPDPKSSEWAEIRDMLHVWALQNWQIIVSISEQLELDLNNRERDVAFAVLCIAKAAGPEIFNNIFTWLQERNKDKGVRDLASDWEYMLWTELQNMVTNPAGQWVTLTEVAQTLAKKIYTGDKNEEIIKMTQKLKRWVPSVIAKVPIFSERRMRHGLTEVKMSPQKILNVMQLKEYPEPETSEKLQTTLPLSTNSTNSPNSPSLYQKQVELVESGESVERKDIDELPENSVFGIRETILSQIPNGGSEIARDAIIPLVMAENKDWSRADVETHLNYLLEREKILFEPSPGMVRRAG